MEPAARPSAVSAPLGHLEAFEFNASSGPSFLSRLAGAQAQTSGLRATARLVHTRIHQSPSPRSAVPRVFRSQRLSRQEQCKHPTHRSSGRTTAGRYRPSFHSGPCASCRRAPLNSNVGRFKSKTAKCSEAALNNAGAALVARSEVRCGKAAVLRTASNGASSKRGFVQQELFVSRAAEHCRSYSGQGWREPPVLRRSAHCCAVLRHSKAQAAAVCHRRGASVQNLNAS